MITFTVYKTTNLLNEKYYIGKHACQCKNCSYIGSGKGLVSAIKKYGKEAFKKEILFVCNSEQEMNIKESELLLPEVWQSEQTYNEGPGGEGGSHFKNRKHNDETKKKISLSRINIPKHKKTEEQLVFCKQQRLKKNKGSYFSAETIERIKKKAIARWERERNIAAEDGNPKKSHKLLYVCSTRTPATI